MNENAEVYFDRGKWELAVRQDVLGSEANPCFNVVGIFDTEEEARQALKRVPSRPVGPARSYSDFLRNG